METKVCDFCENNPHELLQKIQSNEPITEWDHECCGPILTKAFGKEVRLCRRCLETVDRIIPLTVGALPEKYDNYRMDDIVNAMEYIVKRHCWIDGRIISALLDLRNIGWDVYEHHALKKDADMRQIFETAIRQLLAAQFKTHKSKYFRKDPVFEIGIVKDITNDIQDQANEVRNKLKSNNKMGIACNKSIFSSMCGATEKYNVYVYNDKLIYSAHNSFVIDKLNKEVLI